MKKVHAVEMELKFLSVTYLLMAYTPAVFALKAVLFRLHTFSTQALPYIKSSGVEGREFGER